MFLIKVLISVRTFIIFRSKLEDALSIFISCFVKVLMSVMAFMNFRSKVEDDLARADFERALDSRSFKHFKRELGKSQYHELLDDFIITGTSAAVIRRELAVLLAKAWYAEQTVLRAFDAPQAWRSSPIYTKKPWRQLRGVGLPLSAIRFSQLVLALKWRTRQPQYEQQELGRQEPQTQTHLA